MGWILGMPDTYFIMVTIAYLSYIIPTIIGLYIYFAKEAKKEEKEKGKK